MLESWTREMYGAGLLEAVNIIALSALNQVCQHPRGHGVDRIGDLYLTNEHRLAESAKW